MQRNLRIRALMEAGCLEMLLDRLQHSTDGTGLSRCDTKSRLLTPNATADPAQPERVEASIRLGVFHSDLL